MSKWVLYTKRGDFKGIAQKYGIDPLLAKIMVNRGVKEEEMRAYLHPSLDDLADPNLLKDMDLAIPLLQKAIDSDTKIRIIGDYDIDGVCSTYILHQGLLRVGAQVDYMIPNRIEDGYGINHRLIEKCIEDGIGLIITCDNGIAAAKEVDFAKESGLTVIVTDHHEVPYDMVDEKKVYKLPKADAVIDPKREDCPYPYKNICGAVVAWKLILALYRASDLEEKEGMIFLENAAFATIGDVMELTGENRSIVSLGLEQMRHTKNIGLRTLMERCKIDSESLSAYHIGFVLGPCINASGRLDTATKAIELLEARDPQSAAYIAESLQTLNEERKSMTARGVDVAKEWIEKNKCENDAVLVVYLPGIHESVAGIIAGRIREQYERPTFILVDAADGNGAKGSGRSVEGYSMYDEMCKCKDLLSKFGGHPMAAGLSLPVEHIDAFREQMNANNTMPTEDMQTVVHIDAAMPFSYISKQLIDDLEILEPFGNGNSKPVFAQKNVTVRRMIPIGKEKQFLRLDLLGEDGSHIEGLCFNNVEKLKDIASTYGKVAITYYPQVNEFRGNITLQVIVTDVEK